jgi:hypothetical protein
MTKLLLKDFNKLSEENKNAILAEIERHLLIKMRQKMKLDHAEVAVSNHLMITMRIIQMVSSLKSFKNKAESYKI